MRNLFQINNSVPLLLITCNIPRMQYQIYVPLPSLISVDGTDLPYPRLAHMACDHSVEKMKKNTEA